MVRDTGSATQCHRLGITIGGSVPHRTRQRSVHHGPSMQHHGNSHGSTHGSLSPRKSQAGSSTQWQGSRSLCTGTPVVFVYHYTTLTASPESKSTVSSLCADVLYMLFQSRRRATAGAEHGPFPGRKTGRGGVSESGFRMSPSFNACIASVPSAHSAACTTRHGAPAKQL